MMMCQRNSSKLLLALILISCIHIHENAVVEAFLGRSLSKLNLGKRKHQNKEIKSLDPVPPNSASSVSSSSSLRLMPVGDSFPDENTLRSVYDEWRFLYERGDFNPDRYDNFKSNWHRLVRDNLAAIEAASQTGAPPRLFQMDEYGDYSQTEMQQAKDAFGKPPQSSGFQFFDSLEDLEAAMVPFSGMGSRNGDEFAGYEDKTHLKSMVVIDPVKYEYVDWCKKYGRQLDTSRYETFAENYRRFKKHNKNKPVILKENADSALADYSNTMPMTDNYNGGTNFQNNQPQNSQYNNQNSQYNNQNSQHNTQGNQHDSSPSEGTMETDPIEDAYIAWCTEHGKWYEPGRFRVFAQNYRQLQDYYGKDRVLKLNEYADRTKDEYQVIMNAQQEAKRSNESTAAPSEEKIEFKQQKSRAYPNPIESPKTPTFNEPVKANGQSQVPIAPMKPKGQSQVNSTPVEKQQGPVQPADKVGGFNPFSKFSSTPKTSFPTEPKAKDPGPFVPVVKSSGASKEKKLDTPKTKAVGPFESVAKSSDSPKSKQSDSFTPAIKPYDEIGANAFGFDTVNSSSSSDSTTSEQSREAFTFNVPKPSAPNVEQDNTTAESINGSSYSPAEPTSTEQDEQQQEKNASSGSILGNIFSKFSPGQQQQQQESPPPPPPAIEKSAKNDTEISKPIESTTSTTPKSTKPYSSDSGVTNATELVSIDDTVAKPNDSKNETAFQEKRKGIQLATPLPTKPVNDLDDIGPLSPVPNNNVRFSAELARAEAARLEAQAMRIEAEAEVAEVAAKAAAREEQLEREALEREEQLRAKLEESERKREAEEAELAEVAAKALAREKQLKKEAQEREQRLKEELERLKQQKEEEEAKLAETTAKAAAREEQLSKEAQERERKLKAEVAETRQMRLIEEAALAATAAKAAARQEQLDKEALEREKQLRIELEEAKQLRIKEEAKLTETAARATAREQQLLKEAQEREKELKAELEVLKQEKEKEAAKLAETAAKASAREQQLAKEAQEREDKLKTELEESRKLRMKEEAELAKMSEKAKEREAQLTKEALEREEQLRAELEEQTKRLEAKARLAESTAKAAAKEEQLAKEALAREEKLKTKLKESERLRLKEEAEVAEVAAKAAAREEELAKKALEREKQLKAELEESRQQRMKEEAELAEVAAKAASREEQLVKEALEIEKQLRTELEAQTSRLEAEAQLAEVAAKAAARQEKLAMEALEREKKLRGELQESKQKRMADASQQSVTASEAAIREKQLTKEALEREKQLRAELEEIKRLRSKDESFLAEATAKAAAREEQLAREALSREKQLRAELEESIQARSQEEARLAVASAKATAREEQLSKEALQRETQLRKELDEFKRLRKREEADLLEVAKAAAQEGQLAKEALQREKALMVRLEQSEQLRMKESKQAETLRNNVLSSHHQNTTETTPTRTTSMTQKTPTRSGFNQTASSQRATAQTSSNQRTSAQTPANQRTSAQTSANQRATAQTSSSQWTAQTSAHQRAPTQTSATQKPVTQSLMGRPRASHTMTPDSTLDSFPQTWRGPPPSSSPASSAGNVGKQAATNAPPSNIGSNSTVRTVPYKDIESIPGSAVKIAYMLWCNDNSRTPDANRYEIFAMNYRHAEKILGKQRGKQIEMNAYADYTKKEYMDMLREKQVESAIQRGSGGMVDSQPDTSNKGDADKLSSNSTSSELKPTIPTDTKPPNTVESNGNNVKNTSAPVPFAGTAEPLTTAKINGSTSSTAGNVPQFVTGATGPTNFTATSNNAITGDTFSGSTFGTQLFSQEFTAPATERSTVVGNQPSVPEDSPQKVSTASENYKPPSPAHKHETLGNVTASEKPIDSISKPLVTDSAAPGPVAKNTSNIFSSIKYDKSRSFSQLKFASKHVPKGTSRNKPATPIVPVAKQGKTASNTGKASYFGSIRNLFDKPKASPAKREEEHPIKMSDHSNNVKVSNNDQEKEPKSLGLAAFLALQQDQAPETTKEDETKESATSTVSSSMNTPAAPPAPSPNTPKPFDPPTTISSTRGTDVTSRPIPSIPIPSTTRQTAYVNTDNKDGRSVSMKPGGSSPFGPPKRTDGPSKDNFSGGNGNDNKDDSKSDVLTADSLANSFVQTLKNQVPVLDSSGFATSGCPSFNSPESGRPLQPTRGSYSDNANGSAKDPTMFGMAPNKSVPKVPVAKKQWPVRSGMSSYLDNISVSTGVSKVDEPSTVDTLSSPAAAPAMSSFAPVLPPTIPKVNIPVPPPKAATTTTTSLSFAPVAPPAPKKFESQAQKPPVRTGDFSYLNAPSSPSPDTAGMESYLVGMNKANGNVPPKPKETTQHAGQASYSSYVSSKTSSEPSSPVQKNQGSGFGMSSYLSNLSGQQSGSNQGDQTKPGDVVSSPAPTPAMSSFAPVLPPTIPKANIPVPPPKPTTTTATSSSFAPVAPPAPKKFESQAQKPPVRTGDFSYLNTPSSPSPDTAGMESYLAGMNKANGNIPPKPKGTAQHAGQASYSSYVASKTSSESGSLVQKNQGNRFGMSSYLSNLSGGQSGSNQADQTKPGDVVSSSAPTPSMSSFAPVLPPTIPKANIPVPPPKPVSSGTFAPVSPPVLATPEQKRSRVDSFMSSTGDFSYLQTPSPPTPGKPKKSTSQNTAAPRDSDLSSLSPEPPSQPETQNNQNSGFGLLSYLTNLPGQLTGLSSRSSEPAKTEEFSSPKKDNNVGKKYITVY